MSTEYTIKCMCGDGRCKARAVMSGDFTLSVTQGRLKTEIFLPRDVGQSIVAVLEGKQKTPLDVLAEKFDTELASPDAGYKTLFEVAWNLLVKFTLDNNALRAQIAAMEAGNDAPSL